MRSSLPKPLLGSTSSVKVNDCWNKIGVWGNSECAELKHLIHCRNCVVYSSAAAHLLGGELPKDYLEGWTTHFATTPKVESQEMQTALIFRIGAERGPFHGSKGADDLPERHPALGESRTRSSI
jgi:hypothetical protein